MQESKHKEEWKPGGEGMWLLWKVDGVSHKLGHAREEREIY